MEVRYCGDGADGAGGAGGAGGADGYNMKVRRRRATGNKAKAQGSFRKNASIFAKHYKVTTRTPPHT